MRGRIFSISILLALFVSGISLAITGYENLSNFTGWCISIVPFEHELYFTSACNTEYVAALIIGTFAASISLLTLIQTVRARATLFSWEELKLGSLRVFPIVGLAGLGFLFFFFVPIIPNATLFPCNAGTFGGLCLNKPGGLESLGYALISWGAIYGFELGYSAPTIGFPGSTLSDLAVLILLAVPIASASILLLYSKIARGNRRLIPIPVVLIVVLLFVMSFP